MGGELGREGRVGLPAPENRAVSETARERDSVTESSPLEEGSVWWEVQTGLNSSLISLRGSWLALLRGWAQIVCDMIGIRINPGTNVSG